MVKTSFSKLVTTEWVREKKRQSVDEPECTYAMNGWENENWKKCKEKGVSVTDVMNSVEPLQFLRTVKCHVASPLTLNVSLETKQTVSYQYDKPDWTSLIGQEVCCTAGWNTTVDFYISIKTQHTDVIQKKMKGIHKLAEQLFSLRLSQVLNLSIMFC